MGRTNSTRFCVVDTQDGLAELIQTIVSIDDAVIFLRLRGPFLVVHMQSTNHVHIVDLLVLGETVFGTRQNFSPAQAAATVVKGHDDGRDPRWSDIGLLPSLKAILESPSIPKILFDCRPTTAKLHQRYRIDMCGVQDIQLIELAARPNPPTRHLQFHRKGLRAPELRDLRRCLE